MVHDLPLGVLLFLATYLLHSTLLLGGTWLAIRWLKPSSHALCERLWKLAAVGGLLTAAVQLGFMQFGFQPGNPLWYIPRGVVAVDNAPTDDSVTDQPWTTLLPAVRALADRNEPTAHHMDASDFAPSQTAAYDTQRAAADNVRPESFASEPEAFRPDNGCPTAGALPAASDSGLVVLGSTNSAGDGEPMRGAFTHSISIAPVKISWPVVFLSGVGLLVFVGLVRLAVASRVLQRRLRCCRPYRGSARRELDDLCRRAGVGRRVELLCSAEQSEPSAYGVWRWRIVLPERLDRQLSRDDLRALLAHELAHLVRRDTAWLWLGRLLCGCLPFQPLNFLALRRWARSAEFRCDDWAVAQGIERFTLARCLTNIAQWCSKCPGVAVALAAGGSSGHLTDRVERLVEPPAGEDPWSAPRRRHGFAMMAGLLIAGVACFGPTVRPELGVGQSEAGTSLGAEGDRPTAQVTVVERSTATGIESAKSAAISEDIELSVALRPTGRSDDASLPQADDVAILEQEILRQSEILRQRTERLEAELNQVLVRATRNDVSEDVRRRANQVASRLELLREQRIRVENLIRCFHEERSERQ